MVVVVVVAFYSCHNPHEAGTPRDAKLSLFLLKALLQTFLWLLLLSDSLSQAHLSSHHLIETSNGKLWGRTLDAS